MTRTRKPVNYTEALKEYQTALDLNKRSSLAHYSVAQVFLQQGNLSAAANEFRMALNGDSDAQWVEAWAHIRLGQIFDRTNQRDRAINEYVLAARTGDDTDGAKRAIAEYQASLCHESVCSDFVRMKDGTGVTGNWLGSDGDRIQFLADDTPRTYTKAQVYSVLFGAGAPPAPSVAVTSSPAATSPPCGSAGFRTDPACRDSRSECRYATGVRAGSGVGGSGVFPQRSRRVCSVAAEHSDLYAGEGRGWVFAHRYLPRLLCS